MQSGVGEISKSYDKLNTNINEINKEINLLNNNNNNNIIPRNNIIKDRRQSMMNFTTFKNNIDLIIYFQESQISTNQIYFVI